MVRIWENSGTYLGHYVNGAFYNRSGMPLGFIKNNYVFSSKLRVLGHVRALDLKYSIIGNNVVLNRTKMIAKFDKGGFNEEVLIYFTHFYKNN